VEHGDRDRRSSLREVYRGSALVCSFGQALHHYMDERIWKRFSLEREWRSDFSLKGRSAELSKLYEAARAFDGFRTSPREDVPRSRRLRESRQAGATRSSNGEAPCRDRDNRRAGEQESAGCGQGASGPGKASRIGGRPGETKACWKHLIKID